MNFIAMDFETANQRRDSACSLALVVVRDSRIVNQFYSLINPRSEYSYWNTKINGITESMTRNSPDFSAVWPHIQNLFSIDQLVVAHNAKFDNGVLKSCLERYEFDAPHYLTLDTVASSRALYPQLDNYRLNTVSDHLQIKLAHHHHALDDSYACAKIVLTEQEQFGADRLKKFVKVV